MNRRNAPFQRALAVCAITCGLARADLVALQLSPTSTNVTSGSTVSVDIDVSGIGVPGATEVGSFDVFIGFNPTLLAPTGVTFGSQLGDPAAFEALTAFTFSANDVEAAEVSLLSNTQLDSEQASSFTLATLSFQAIGSGVADFQFDGGPVDDGNGLLIAGTKTVAPEPSFLLLVAVLLAGCAGLRWRRGYESR